MTLPPIKEAEARPPIELVGVTADSPFPPDLGSGGDLFGQLSTHVLLYPIPIIGSGTSIQNFVPFVERGYITPDAGPVNLLQTFYRQIFSGVPGAVGVEPSPAHFNTDLFAIGCDAASAEPSWRFHARFGHIDGFSGNRLFAGLAGSVNTIDDPTTELVPHIGIRVRASDSTYQFSHSDGVSETFVDLGVAVPFISTNGEPDGFTLAPVQIFDLFISSVKGAAGFVWNVVDVLTGLSVGSGTATTNIPSPLQTLRYFVQNRGQLIATLDDQWKQQAEVIALSSVFYKDFPYGPFGVDERGGSDVIPTDGGGGGPPPFDWPWSEAFDEADLAAFKTKYLDYSATTGTGAFGGGGHGQVESDYVSVSGGALEIKGAAFPYLYHFGPPLTATPAREYWMRLRFEMVGGDFDGTTIDPVRSLTQGVVSLENDFNTRSGSTPRDYYIQAWQDGNTGILPITRAVPAGSHEFIVCASEDDAVTQRVEAWVDAAPGDPADASVTTSKDSGDAYNYLDVFLVGPTGTALTLRCTGIDYIAGSRASDPFGIL